MHSKHGAAGARQTQCTPAVKLMHAHTANTQQQLLPHCQALGNPEQPPRYPQIALGQSLKAANKATSGKPRHAVALHTLTTRHILLQKAPYLPPLDTSLVVCDSLPVCRTAVVCLPRDGVTWWQRGRLSVLTAPANCREAPQPVPTSAGPLLPCALWIPVTYFKVVLIYAC